MKIIIIIAYYYYIITAMIVNKEFPAIKEMFNRIS